MHQDTLRAAGRRVRAGEFRQRRERLVGLACGVAVVLLFSGFTLVSRSGMHSALAPADLAALRFGIGGLLLLPVFARHGLSGLRVPEALALCFLGGFGFALFAYSGFFRAPASHGAVLLHGTLPFFTAGLARIVLKERLRGVRLAGLALILAGIAMMASDSLRGATPRQVTGGAFLLAAAFCWSAYGIMVNRIGLPALRAVAIVAVFALAIYLPVYLVFLESGLPNASAPELAGQALFQGGLIGACSIFVYTRAVTALSASRAALLTAAVPIVTALAAVPLLGERPTALVVAGIAAVTVGTVIAVRRVTPSVGEISR